MFKAVLVELKREGFGNIEHHAEIRPEDLKKLYSSVAMSPDTPLGLLHKVWFDMMFFMCRRGRENLRPMTRETFSITVDASDRRYVYQVTGEMDKNHREDDSSKCDPRMYAWPGCPGHRLCPVQSFEKYLSKLNPDNNALWQKPRGSFTDDEDVWYTKCPLGVNTLGSMMATISKQAKLSMTYKNHCIRSTGITCLDAANFEARHIMQISGHKSENSIRSYSRHVTESQKQNMSDTLSTAVRSDDTDQPEDEYFSVDGDIILSDVQLDNLIDEPKQGNEISTEPAPQPGPSVEPNSMWQNVLSLPGFNMTPNLNNSVVTFNFIFK